MLSHHRTLQDVTNLRHKSVAMGEKCPFSRPHSQKLHRPQQLPSIWLDQRPTYRLLLRQRPGPKVPRRKGRPLSPHTTATMGRTARPAISSAHGGGHLSAVTYVHDVVPNCTEEADWSSGGQFAFDCANAFADLRRTNTLQPRQLYSDGVDEFLACITGASHPSTGPIMRTQWWAPSERRPRAPTTAGRRA
jgi:hypothetical protein